MDIRPLKVSEVNTYIKRVFLSDMILSNLSIEGEISNFKHHYSGHMYFNLKDEKGKIKSVMFRTDNEKLKFNLEDGMKVVATGYISIYEKEGDYQFYIRHIKESGLGDLYKAFEELKKKLEAEGMFSESNKKPIPFMPKKIGVVTSSTGAAIRDIITVIRRRFPPCCIFIYPSLVQGLQAPKEICEGLIYLDSRNDIDLIITGRGGGSIEELFAFNDEQLARTIYKLKTPIISAVGHEVDFTIADFVADLRAPTPSAAAELSVPDIEHLTNELESKYKRLIRNIYSTVDGYRTQIDYLNRNLKFSNPTNQLKDKRQEIDNLFKDLNYVMEKKIGDKLNQLSSLKNSLNMLNPRLALDRGYGILTDNKGKLVKSIDNIVVDEEINILLKDGKIKSIVRGVDKGESSDEK
ncbi:Exodeoxyribonuclease VII large subunit [Tissierella praeacuta DSM 18095]|uniref:Exodeoxyribonuclease 7 large subunit n=1 Tax=Tissierella praeacuta DSM 18095 TaxID=1123404 RepID=A0A1M4SDG0_9FIRM|nr:exodeoxyribonuclease VII large subunit [Tissierella praeacuta]SHE30195.1 Exodeoxyribonuclease VII large subunit [Tissierella praeacuta DSM 18095]SUP01307.1 Exodeoxyribonuclease 7 large subunit [Tissierella praeacuta]